MDAVDPEIDVALGREIALAPAHVLVRPGVLEPPDGRGREPAGVLAEQREERGSAKVPGCESWKTLASVTAYHSFGGEVEASSTPTTRRLTPLMPSPTFAHSCMANWLRLYRGLNGVKDEQRVPTIFIK